jgi:exosortase/archaeosortase family protein
LSAEHNPDTHDGSEAPAHRSRRAPWLMALMFVLSVAALQWGWRQASGTAVERAVIDQATVRLAVGIINTVTPQVQASALGSRISAPGGGINVLNGCEGTEVLALVVAALLAYPMQWRWRLIGALSGAALVFALNQARLLALFYSYRTDRAVFDALHGLIAPLLLILASLVFVMALIRLDERSRPA